MERNTRQRDAVLAAIEHAGRALTPGEILALAQASVASLNLSTIYRQIGALQGEARLVKVMLPGQTPRYEPVCGQRHGDAGHHHHHFHCRVCDCVFALHACPGSMQDLVPKGFAVEAHEITLHGRCPDCRRGAHA